MKLKRGHPSCAALAIDAYRGKKNRTHPEKMTDDILNDNVWRKPVYYESIKRELKIRGIYECRCDERLQTGDEYI